MARRMIWALLSSVIVGPGAAAAQQASDPPAAIIQQDATETPPAANGQDYTTYPDPGRPRAIVPENADTPPEKVVAGLSSDAVSITASFDGSNILIYGAVKRETPVPDGPPLEVIVTIEGPSQALTVRRKERKLGIWINTESLQVGAAPSFYVVSSSAPLDQILRPDWDTRYRISVPLALRSFAGPLTVDDTVPFTEALLRLRDRGGLYRSDAGGVRVVDQTLFNADVRLPANLIEGDYKTRIFLLRDGRVIDDFRAPIAVRKVGIERWLYRLAFDQPLLYGLMSLAVAIAAGWGASSAFRLARRQ